MARQEIILGTPPSGLGGDPPRTASQKVNFMTQELYEHKAQLGTASTANITSATDETYLGGAYKVTKQGDYGLGRPLSARAVSDADLPIKNNAGAAFHYLGARYPGTSDGALLTMGFNEQYAFQMFGNGRNGDLYTRNTAVGEERPKKWRKNYHEDNVIGAIESGGVIESGVNSYGGYTKFRDGTLLCYGEAQPVNAAPANATVSNQPTMFAHPFSTSTPTVIPTATPLSNHDHYGVIGINYGAETGSSRFTLFVRNGATVQNFRFWFLAIGRWKA